MVLPFYEKLKNKNKLKHKNTADDIKSHDVGGCIRELNKLTEFQGDERF